MTWDSNETLLANLLSERDLIFMAKGKTRQQLVGAEGISLKMLQLSNRAI